MGESGQRGPGPGGDGKGSVCVVWGGGGGGGMAVPAGAVWGPPRCLGPRPALGPGVPRSPSVPQYARPPSRGGEGGKRAPGAGCGAAAGRRALCPAGGGLRERRSSRRRGCPAPAPLPARRPGRVCEAAERPSTHPLPPPPSRLLQALIADLGPLAACRQQQRRLQDCFVARFARFSPLLDGLNFSVSLVALAIGLTAIADGLSQRCVR